MTTSSERALIISSDGHAMPKMRDYRPYLPASLQDRFDDFCVFYDEHGALPMDPRHLARRLDPDVLDQWVRDVYEPGRLEGCSDPVKRLTELRPEGVVAEVLFPDFGLPFEGVVPTPTRRYEASSQLWPPRTPEEIDEGNKAHNRWLVDYCSVAPERFAGMAVVSFDDIEDAMVQIRWAREAGLKGVLLPTFSAEHPIFHSDYDPIWSLLEDLEMPVNSHIAISATLPMVRYAGVAHPAVANTLHGDMRFRCHEVLSHLIWGGVLERHPKLGVALTEQGSDWVIGALESWDYSYEGSFQRRDVREVVPLMPSEYFRRQCWLGSSLFSRAEVEARHRIGIDQMLLGMDYPHHEGTLAHGTVNYLRATLGAAGVPAAEARRLLGENAVERWKFDTASLRPLADEFGPELELLLTPPDIDFYPRGDVHRPLSTV